MSEDVAIQPGGDAGLAPSASIRASIERAEASLGRAPDPIRSFEDDFDGPEAEPDKGAKKTERQKRLDSIKRAEAKLREMAAGKENPKDQPERRKATSANATEDRKLRSDIIDRSIERAKSGAKPDAKDLNTDEMRQTRRELRQRYPNHNLGEMLEQFEKWEGMFRKDPMAAREAIMEAYLRSSPQNYAKGKQAQYSPGIRGSIERGEQDARDIAELKPFIDKYGKDFPRLLQQLNRFDADMIDDPVGTSARLAANYGIPITEEQHQQAAQAQQHAAERQQRVSNIELGLSKIIEHKIMPGIEDPKLQDKIVGVLENPAFQRSGDPLNDLTRAWQIALQTPDGEVQAKSTKGTKSISGAPGNLSQSTTKHKSKSNREALDRADGGI
jgi:hypothetical protein